MYVKWGATRARPFCVSFYATFLLYQQLAISKTAISHTKYLFSLPVLVFRIKKLTFLCSVGHYKSQTKMTICSFLLFSEQDVVNKTIDFLQNTIFTTK